MNSENFNGGEVFNRKLHADAHDCMQMLANAYKSDAVASNA
jgi:hypothetical protein